jgi:hypothetical protein
VKQGEFIEKAAQALFEKENLAEPHADCAAQVLYISSRIHARVAELYLELVGPKIAEEIKRGVIQ